MLLLLLLLLYYLSVDSQWTMFCCLNIITTRRSKVKRRTGHVTPPVVKITCAISTISLVLKTDLVNLLNLFLKFLLLFIQIFIYLLK